MTADFYLGTHIPSWLTWFEVPLFVSHRRLKDRATMPEATTNWALDSGGFTELHKYGRWDTTAHDYTRAVHRYADEIGHLDWCAPQDWMCEPSARTQTGLTVAEHQRLTVENFLTLRDALGLVVVPVLQGWERDDYLRCVELYEGHGVALEAEARVGLGSVCRRNADSEIAAIIRSLQPLRLHAFGVKGSAWARCHHLLKSADSMAWSARGRRSRLPGCTHQNCANCPRWAMRWHAKTIRLTQQQRLLA